MMDFEWSPHFSGSLTRSLTVDASSMLQQQSEFCVQIDTPRRRLSLGDASSSDSSDSPGSVLSAVSPVAMETQETIVVSNTMYGTTTTTTTITVQSDCGLVTASTTRTTTQCCTNMPPTTSATRPPADDNSDQENADPSMDISPPQCSSSSQFIRKPQTQSIDTKVEPIPWWLSPSPNTKTNYPSTGKRRPLAPLNRAVPRCNRSTKRKRRSSPDSIGKPTDKRQKTITDYFDETKRSSTHGGGSCAEPPPTTSFGPRKTAFMSPANWTSSPELPEIPHVDKVGDGSRFHHLPRFKHKDLHCITADTLAMVFKGETLVSINDVIIIDCRYPFEYEGGHVKSALNIYLHDQMLNRFLYDMPIDQLATSGDQGKIIVFYCEFSQKRGPKMYRTLRSHDRRVHKNVYPRLRYPEVYVLQGGYREFRRLQHRHAFCNPCTEPNYIEMKDKQFRLECTRSQREVENSMRQAQQMLPEQAGKTGAGTLTRRRSMRSLFANIR